MANSPCELDWEKIEKLASFNLSLDEICWIEKADFPYLNAAIKKKYGLTFSEFQNKCKAHIKVKLIDQALNQALSNRRSIGMLIFCLKNYCGWSNEPGLIGGNPNGSGIKKFILAYDDKNIIEAAKKTDEMTIDVG